MPRKTEPAAKSPDTQTPPLWEAWREGKRIEVTNNEACIPPPEILQSMQDAGYTFLMNGREWKVPQPKAGKGKK